MHLTPDREDLFEALITHLEQGLDLCIGQDRDVQLPAIVDLCRQAYETATRLNRAD